MREFDISMRTFKEVEDIVEGWKLVSEEEPDVQIKRYGTSGVVMIQWINA